MKTSIIAESNHLAFLLLAVNLFSYFYPLQQSYDKDKMTIKYTVAEKALQATVKLEATYFEDTISTLQKGTGTIISNNGLIITNYHNIINAKFISVINYKGDRYVAEIITIEPRMDLALLKINAHHLPFLTFGSSETLQLGESVFAIGNPMNLDFSLTSGVVSAFNRQLNVIEHSRRLEQFIQTDVPINAGCSGGPLLNQRGELVGINTAIVAKSGRFEGYSFAVPVELVKEFIEKEITPPIFPKNLK